MPVYYGDENYYGDGHFYGFGDEAEDAGGFVGLRGIGKIIVATAEVWDSGATPNLRTLYWSTARYATQPDDFPSNVEFQQIILSAGGLTRTLLGAGTTTGRSRVGYGEIILANTTLLDAEGTLDHYADLGFDGRTLKIYFGDNPVSFPDDFEEIMVGTMLPPVIGPDEVIIRPRDLQETLNIPLQDKYLGDNVLPDGLEGQEPLRGKSKPYLAGRAFNVEPKLVNASNLIYQVCDEGFDEVALFDSGVDLEATPLSFVANDPWGTADDYAYDAEYADGTYMVVGRRLFGPYVGTSTDGVSYTRRTTSHMDQVNSLAYSPDDDRWVIVGNNGEASFSDTSGVAWSSLVSVAPFGTSRDITGVAYGSSHFVAVGPNPVGTTLARSAQGSVWSTKSSGVNAGLRCVEYGGGTFLSAGDGGVLVASYDDGDTWSVLPIIGTGSTDITGLAYHAGEWIAAAGSQGLWRSDDGVNFGQVYDPDPTNSRFIGVSYSDALSHWMAYGEYFTGGVREPLLSISPDGISWQSVTSGLASPQSLQGFAESSNDLSVYGESGESTSSGSTEVYLSEAELLDDARQPGRGTYGVYADGGYVRLGSEPVGRLTATVNRILNEDEDLPSGETTHAQIFVDMLTKVGKGNMYSTADYADLNARVEDPCGIYLSDSTTVADALDIIAESISGWWGVDRKGLFRIRKLLTPQVPYEAPVASLYDRPGGDLISPLRRVPTEDVGGGLPFWRTELRWRRNHTVQSDGLAGSVSPERRAELGQRWRIASDSDPGVLDKHPLAAELEYDTLFWYEVDAAQEALFTQQSRGLRHDRLQCTIPMTIENVQLDLGQVITMYSPRFGMDAGRNHVIIGLETDPDSLIIRLDLWG